MIELSLTIEIYIAGVKNRAGFADELGYQWGRKSRNWTKNLFCLAPPPIDNLSPKISLATLHLNYEVWSRCCNVPTSYYCKDDIIAYSNN